MNRILLLLTFILAFEGLNLAQVDSMTVDGQQYYIYPFRQEVEIHSDYWIAVDDEDFYADYRNYFIEFDEVPDYFEAKDFYEADDEELKYLYKMLDRRWNSYRKKGGRLSLGHKFVKQVRKNPYPLLEVKYQFDKEVIPPFGSIPDGKYVQLFEDFCLVDEKGNCQPQEKRIAAYFSIKNNAIDGEAVWMNLQGDTIKSGRFENGLKTGAWTQNSTSSIPRYLYKWSVKSYKKTGQFDFLDTFFLQANYENGILHGDFISEQYSYEDYKTTGSYKDGKPFGNWRVFNDSVLLMNVTYADPDDSTLSYRPIIRSSAFITNYEYDKYDTYPEEYQLIQIPSDFYEIGFEKEPDVELEEEKFQSHTLEYSYGNYYGDRIPDRLYSNRDYYMAYPYFSFEEDPRTEYVETRGHFIDSLGAKMLFDGAYELYYPNGQLYTRYLFENGELVNEDTLFWDNGMAHDVIEFIADSNHYVRTAYDYKGVPFKQLVYDSLGDFSHFIMDRKELLKMDIDGYEATVAEYIYTYQLPFDTLAKGDLYYNNWDALEDTLTETTVMYKYWSGFDKKELVSTTYDPVERKLVYFEKNYDGKEFSRTEKTFTEDFEGWTGKTRWKIGNYEVVETASAILDEFENDTMPQTHVGTSYSDYDVTSDYVVYKDGIEYSGPVKLNLDKGKFSLSKNTLTVDFSESWRSKKKFYKKMYKHFDKGKPVNDQLFDITNSINEAQGLTSRVYYELFGGFISEFFGYNFGYNDFGFGYYDRRYEKKNTIVKVTGQMKDGKPEGIWKGYNKKGKVMNEITFINGEAEGTFKEYHYELKATKWERMSSDEPLPDKTVFHLWSTTEYENGMKNGAFRVYNWNGETSVSGSYVDDLLDGEYLERYHLAYSKSNYKEGALDGYVQTYLTLPYEDTLLLYDLNFQHGLLNGESVAYHTNGRVAKRGFFLDGEPIEDYEAYDTLGFKFHYVKFQYGFPVEEKIWEENELSVRYAFNWQDSIIFDPSDITSTMSLQSLLYKLGYGLEYLQQEYYGRPRLINKEGLEYHMTKYYPNDTVARDGRINDGKKFGHWDFYSYEGEFLYEVEYFDSIIKINDSIIFKSKGVLTDYNAAGDSLYKAYIIEKMEKYDCAHTDHYEIRQLYTVWEANDTLGRMNGFVRNYYDNGVLQNEGYMKDGLPDGLWKFYDPYGKLNLMGQYNMGKRNGRWLSGDLGKKKYLGEICLNPDLPDLEKEIEYRENLLDVTIINYKLGKALNKQFYDLNMNKYSEYQDEED